MLPNNILTKHAARLSITESIDIVFLVEQGLKPKSLGIKVLRVLRACQEQFTQFLMK
jgi:hypothetical protein